MPIAMSDVEARVKEAHAKGAYNLLNGKERIAAFIVPDPVKAGAELGIGPDSYKIDDDAYVVFVDLRYDANFAHPVIYELYNMANGEVKTIQEEWPPRDFEMERRLKPVILPKEG